MTDMSTAYPEIPVEVHNAMIVARAALMAEERHGTLCTARWSKVCEECRRLGGDTSWRIEQVYRAIARTMQVRW